jgi:hypothetical protein
MLIRKASVAHGAAIFCGFYGCRSREIHKKTAKKISAFSVLHSVSA